MDKIKLIINSEIMDGAYIPFYITVFIVLIIIVITILLTKKELRRKENEKN